MDENLPFVSVIVPVYKNIEYFSRCIELLIDQSYDSKLYEIIVVDNNLSPSDKIKSITSDNPQIKLLHRCKPGSYAARNTGVKASQGTVLAFTDADCLVSENWIQNAIDFLEKNPDCKYLAGPINYFFEPNIKVTSYHWYENINSFPKDKYLVCQKGAPTANIFSYKDVFNQVGGFNENLKSVGDMEWGQRVYKAGFKQMFATDVFVNHPVRKTMKDFILQQQRISGGVYEYFLGNHKGHSYIKRHIGALFLVGYDFKETISIFKNIYNFKDNRLKNKLNIYFVAIYITIIKSFEKVHIHFGGKSKRL